MSAHWLTVQASESSVAVCLKRVIALKMMVKRAQIKDSSSETGLKEEGMSPLTNKGGKGGGKGGGSAPNPNWPSKTGNPSGPDRGNNPPKK